MVATFTRLRSGKANSLGAFAVQNNDHRLQQDVNVEPDGPVSNIEEILRLEARSGTRRGDCETATTKRVKRPKRYPTEARSRGLSCKKLTLFVRMFAMAFSVKVEFGLP